MNHNEINGLEKPLGNFYILILRDTNDHPRILKRIDIFKQIAQEKGITAEIIDLQGKNNLEKIFNNFLFSNWTSYYLSQEYNINPDLAVMVEDLKSRLG